MFESKMIPSISLLIKWKDGEYHEKNGCTFTGVDNGALPCPHGLWDES